MSVIAWDGKTIAADRRGTRGGCIYTVPKLFRAGRYVAGFTGDADRVGQFRKWLEDGAEPSYYPNVPDGVSCYILAIRDDGTVWFFERTAFPTQVTDLFFATGSGRDYALAAMYLGKTAEAAVGVACVFDETCGNGIDKIVLSEETPSK